MKDNIPTYLDYQDRRRGRRKPPFILPKTKI